MASAPAGRRAGRRACLAGLAGLALLAVAGLAAWGADPARLTILHANDVYRLEPVDGGQAGGIARVAALRAQLQAAHPHVMLVLAGDTLSPSVSSKFFQGRQMIEGWNAAGLDLATFGNHEFDAARKEVLLDRIRESRFTWVASNVVDAATGRPFAGSVETFVRDVGGHRVGFLGLTMARPDRPYARFEEPIAAARRAVAGLRGLGVAAIVAVTHLDLPEDQRLGRAVPEIDLILGGHEHDRVISIGGRALIAKADSDLRTVNLVELTVGEPGGPRVAVKVLPVTPDLPEAPAVAALVAGWGRRLAEQLGPDEVLGRTRVPLDGLESAVRSRETNLGNLVADAIREAAGAEVALMNAGGIRLDDVLRPGPIHKTDVHAVLLFDNRVARLRLTGAQLREVLDQAVGQAGKGAFLQVSGLRVRYDASRPAGSRLLEVRVGDRPLDPAARYTLATADFLATGGDGYTVLKSAERLPDAGSPASLTQVTMDWIKRRGEIAPQVEGRLVPVRSP
jgi:5'-nucleotidase